MLEYAHIALCGPRQCMNMPVLHSLAPDSAISYPESAITMVEPRAIYYQREELYLSLDNVIFIALFWHHFQHLRCPQDNTMVQIGLLITFILAQPTFSKITSRTFNLTKLTVYIWFWILKRIFLPFWLIQIFFFWINIRGGFKK